jgi:hypothetical protein
VNQGDTNDQVSGLLMDRDPWVRRRRHATLFDVDRLPLPDIQAAVHSNAGLIFDLDQYLDGMLDHYAD